MLQSLARTMQMPEDLARGTLLVTMYGQNHLLIENFNGISSYTEEKICLLARRTKLCIIGRRLQIDCYTKEEIEISGRICRLEYE
jgi:sporulation protein YqfC